MRNLLDRGPKSAQGLAAVVVRPILAQPASKEIPARHERPAEEKRYVFDLAIPSKLH